jgi:uncharacterized membrane protein
MRVHLDVLGRLHFVWGLFGVLTGASLGVLATGTLASLLGLGSLGRAEQAAVWVLLTCAVALTSMGVCTLVVGRALRRRSPAGRMTALVLAVANLVIVPFGTALGIYTFWVLLNDDARVEFGRPARGVAPRTLTPAGGA